MLYTPSYGNFRYKVEISEFTTKKAAPLDVSGSPSVVMEILGKKFKILDFFLQFFKIMDNFEKLRSIISKVGIKFWRWEGYIGLK